MDAAALAEAVIYCAAEDAEEGCGDRVEQSVRTLEGLLGERPDPMWTLSGCIERALRAAWQGGWQPADVVHAARKRLGARHADLAVTAVASEARASTGGSVTVPPAWAAQLGDLGADVWWDVARGSYVGQWAGSADLEAAAGLRVGVELLGMLTHLPVLPCLLPPPAEWRAGRRQPRVATPGSVDARLLTKVRALLSKAESTNFDGEADALTAKAEELMARHAIDHAMLACADRGESPTGRRVAIEDPYALGKSHLLSVVARTNRCRTVWYDAYGFSTVFGFPVDIDIVEILYTSLLVQSTRAMAAAGSVRDHLGRSRTRSFRQSFLVAFAGRIGERLQSAATTAEHEAGAVHGRSMLPVLAGRSAEVDDAVAAAYPDLVDVNLSITNRDGWIAGRVAADLAYLGSEQQLPGLAV